jgi:hypothetical protein
MRFLAFLLVPTLFAGVLFAADPVKLPEPFHSLADLAMAAPPEFSADGLLRIVESGRVPDRNSRRALVEQAFQTAASAKFRVRMQAVDGAVTDTESGSLNQAYGLGLDVLSLQSRAVRDMLPLDPAKARDLFAQIATPVLPPLTCDDALVYKPDEYYQALSAVVNGSFTAKEKAAKENAKDEQLNLLTDVLGQATSPLELAPLASVIESAGVTAAQRQLLWARFNGLMAAMQPDGRSFEATPEQYRPKGHACETGPKLERYWQSGAAKQLLDAGKKLRYGPGDRALSDADRAAPQWQQQLSDYLNLIADWTSDQELSDAIYYHEKCLVYISLLDIVPAGSQREQILADFADFVSNSGLYQNSPAEWFSDPHTLLDRSQTDPALHAKVLEAYQRSGNPVLVLAVALDKGFPRT